MSTLYTCYSPRGEKFELSKANYMDCVTHHGFTVTPPSDIAFDESEMEINDEFEQEELGSDEQEQDAEETASEDADEGEEVSDEEEVIEEAAEPLTFESAADAKEYLRAKGVQFDGRLSLADLTALANDQAA